MKKFWIIGSLFILAIIGQILTVNAAATPTGLGGLGTSTVPAAGQIPIGVNSSSYTPAYLLCTGNCSVATSSGSITINVPATSSSSIQILPVSVATSSYSIVGDGTYVNVTNPGTSTIKISLSTAQVLQLLSAASPLGYNSSTGQFTCASCLTSLNGALLVTNNLSDVASTTAARLNLGLGSIATFKSTDYLPSSTQYVSSVNGATGTVTITSSSLGVLGPSNFLPSSTQYVASVNGATGTVSITSSSLNVVWPTVNGNKAAGYFLVPGSGVTSTVSGATTTITLNLGAGCTGGNFVQTISPTGTITCATPSGGASSTNVFGASGVTVVQVGVNATASLNTAYAATWTALESFANGITANGTTTLGSSTNALLVTNASGTVLGYAGSNVCGAGNAATAISATGTIACSPVVTSVNGSSGAVTITSSSLNVVWPTVNGNQSTAYQIVGDGTTITSTASGATTTFSLINTGNWAGTWQNATSGTYYPYSNPLGFVTSTSGGSSTVNLTGSSTAFTVPLWGDTSGTILGSSTFSYSSSTGLWTLNSNSTSVGSQLLLRDGATSTESSSITIQDAAGRIFVLQGPYGGSGATIYETSTSGFFTIASYGANSAIQFVTGTSTAQELICPNGGGVTFGDTNCAAGASKYYFISGVTIGNSNTFFRQVAPTGGLLIQGMILQGATTTANVSSSGSGLTLAGSFAVNGTSTTNGINNTGNVTTTNLTITALGSSGNPCLNIASGGAVGTTTCITGIVASGTTVNAQTVTFGSTTQIVPTASGSTISWNFVSNNVSQFTNDAHYAGTQVGNTFTTGQTINGTSTLSGLTLPNATSGLLAVDGSGNVSATTSYVVSIEASGSTPLANSRPIIFFTDSPLVLQSHNTGGTMEFSCPTCLTTSTNLTTANFASPNISQWTNDAGYVTSTITIQTSTAAGTFNVTSSGNKTFTITIPPAHDQFYAPSTTIPTNNNQISNGSGYVGGQGSGVANDCVKWSNSSTIADAGAPCGSGGGGGITSLNGSTSSAQTIVAGTGITITEATSSGNQTTTITSTVNPANYIASSTTQSAGATIYDATTTGQYKYTLLMPALSTTTLTLFGCQNVAATTTYQIIDATSSVNTAGANVVTMTCGTSQNTTSSFSIGNIASGTFMIAITTSTVGTPTRDELWWSFNNQGQ